MEFVLWGLVEMRKGRGYSVGSSDSADAGGWIRRGLREWRSSGSLVIWRELRFYVFFFEGLFGIGV